MAFGCSVVKKSRALAAFRSQVGTFVTVVTANEETREGSAFLTSHVGRRRKNVLPPGVWFTVSTWEGVVETEVTDATDPRRLGVMGTADIVERRDGVGGRGFESEV